MQLPTIVETSPEKPVSRRLSLGVNIPINERPQRQPGLTQDLPVHKPQTKSRRRNSTAFGEAKYSLVANEGIFQAISRAFTQNTDEPRLKSNRRVSLDIYTAKASAKVLKEPERKKRKLKASTAQPSAATVVDRRASISQTRRRQSIAPSAATKTTSRRQSRAFSEDESAIPSYARPTMSSRNQRVKS